MLTYTLQHLRMIQKNKNDTEKSHSISELPRESRKTNTRTLTSFIGVLRKTNKNGQIRRII